MCAFRTHCGIVIDHMHVLCVHHFLHAEVCSRYLLKLLASLVPRPSLAPVFDLFLHTASNQKLELGKVWEQDYC